jgi:hypothetical protein
MRISGQVFDSNNEPLASANVTLRSGAQAGKLGVVTNLDGMFSMDNDYIDSDSIFEISYLGFVSQVWKASELQDKDVTMLDKIEQLDEVIVLSNNKPKAASFSKGNNNIEKNKKHLLIATAIVLGFLAYKKFKK